MTATAEGNVDVWEKVEQGGLKGISREEFRSL
jgi:hypothetical protein